MAHIVRDAGWGTIDIILHGHRIFFQQRWQYRWLTAAGQPAWTLREKREFHASVDRDIWRSWSNKVKLRASGRHRVADGRDWPMNLDVRWVTSGGQWTVSVTKLAPGTRSPTSSVLWASRRITLDTGDFTPHAACTSAATPVCRDNFRTVPHEVGHAFGNTSTLGRGHEYVASSPHLADTASVMNIGTELRARHFRTILDEMNGMIPRVTWTVRSIRN